MYTSVLGRDAPLRSMLVAKLLQIQLEAIQRDNIKVCLPPAFCVNRLSHSEGGKTQRVNCPLKTLICLSSEMRKVKSSFANRPNRFYSAVNECP